MANISDSALIAEAAIIKNETVKKANSAARIGAMLDDLIGSKVNNDKILFSMLSETLVQSGSAIPVGTNLGNDTGGTVAYTRTSAGLYVATISGTTFPSAKTLIPVNYILKISGSNLVEITFTQTSTTAFQISTKTGTLGSMVATDGLLNGELFEVRKYK